MRVALIGYMGSGKSFWAKKLAKQLQIEFLDLDNTLEKYDLKESISSFIYTKGELAFRKLERERLNTIANQNGDLVLATGGGTPCYYNNMDVLNQSFSTVYIDCSIAELFECLVAEKEKRPLISHLDNQDLKEFIAKHLFERRVFYHKAQHVVKADELSLDKLIQIVNS